MEVNGYSVNLATGVVKLYGNQRVATAKTKTAREAWSKVPVVVVAEPTPEPPREREEEVPVVAEPVITPAPSRESPDGE